MSLTTVIQELKMDNTTSFLTGYATGKVMDNLVTQFRTHVIARWSKQRAEEFFYQFCREVEREITSGDTEKVNSMLQEIIEDEVKSEILFDAYRRVSLSRSKRIGPRVIGLITARLVVAGQTASDEEDNMLLAAENLTDDELTEFAKFVREQKEYASDDMNKDVVFNKHGDLQNKWCKEQFDSNWPQGTDVSLAPLDLGESLGRWAAKLKTYGVIMDDVKERQWDYQEDSERHIDEPGTVREVSWWIYVPKAYFEFAELIDRASGAASATETESKV